MTLGRHLKIFFNDFGEFLKISMLNDNFLWIPLQNTHTYVIIITHPSGRITTWLLTLLVFSVFSFINKRIDLYSLKSIPNDRFLRKLSQSFCHKSAEIDAENIFLNISAWGLNPGRMSAKPTHYLLGYGDFKYGYMWNIKDFGETILPFKT